VYLVTFGRLHNQGQSDGRQKEEDGSESDARCRTRVALTSAGGCSDSGTGCTLDLRLLSHNSAGLSGSIATGVRSDAYNTNSTALTLDLVRWDEEGDRGTRRQAKDGADTVNDRASESLDLCAGEGGKVELHLRVLGIGASRDGTADRRDASRDGRAGGVGENQGIGGQEGSDLCRSKAAHGDAARRRARLESAHEGSVNAVAGDGCLVVGIAAKVV